MWPARPDDPRPSCVSSRRLQPLDRRDTQPGVRVDRHAERCASCGLKLAGCICASMPRLHSRVRFVLIRHYKEAWKTSNSGRVLARCLPETRVYDWRGRGGPWTAPELPPGSWLLFPGDEARPAAALRDIERPVVVLIDGTWKQSRKMCRQVPGLAALPRLSLRAQPLPLVLRRRVVPGGLCTAEAAARLLIAAGEEAAGRGLLAAWQAQVRHILRSKGLRPDTRIEQLGASPRAHYGGSEE